MTLNGLKHNNNTKMYFHDDFDNCDLFEVLDGDHRAALLELSEEIANIEAEIQKLKEAKLGLSSTSSDSAPGYAHAAYGSEQAQRKGSSTDGGLKALASPAKNNKRTRGNISTLQGVSPLKKKRRTAPKVTGSTSAIFPFVSKEQLLSAITDELPPQYLEGVIRIVKPAFDPATALDEDLEFDINLLDDEVLHRLTQYVHNALTTPQATTKKVTREQRPRNTKAVKREAPKQRLKKEANPKKRRPQAQRRSTSLHKRATQQQHYLSTSYFGQKKTNSVNSEVFREIFKTEQIIKVQKYDSEAEDEEDEDVDVVGF